MRKALFVAYFFPPLGGAGVQRTTKFIKYLPKFGWNSAVLTAKNPTFLYRDESLLEDIPKKTEIYRTFHFDPFGGRFKKTLKEADVQTKVSITRELKRKFKTFSQSVYKNFFPLETLQVWSAASILKGQEIIKREGVKLIYSTFSPAAGHFIAYVLKKKTNLPWVADFRDFWTGNSILPLKGPRRIIESFLEKRVVRKADHIIVASDLIGEYLVEKYSMPKSKVSTITNGFDSDDFKDKVQVENSEFSIAYTGTVYWTRSPVSFFKGLKKFLDENPKAKKVTKIKFVGSFFDKEGIELIKGFDLTKNIEIIDYLPHSEAITINKKSSVLLLLIDFKDTREAKAIYTGKIFEYIASDRPILCIGPKSGVAAELVRQTRTGVVVDPDDINEIAKALKQFYKEWEVGQLNIIPRHDIIEKYSREHLTGQLAKIFDKLVR